MASTFNFIEYLQGIPKSYYRAYKKRILPAAPLKIAGNAKDFNLLGDTLDQRGVVATASMAVTSPYVKMHILFDGVDYTANVNEIMTANIETPVQNLPYITTYNPLLGIYSLNWSPYRGFNDNVVVTFDNDDPNDIYILELLVEIYIFKAGFYKKLSELRNQGTDNQ